MTRALGADGARAGWVVCVLDDGVVVDVALVDTMADAVDRWAPDRVAVDMPIGFVDAPVRDAEVAARALLPGRASTVFGVPCRTVVDEVRSGRLVDHAAATARQVEVTGKGLSVQAWGLLPRIVEVDDLRARVPDVLEVHPETAFATIAGSPLVRKTSWEGVARRRDLLVSQGVHPPSRFDGSDRVAPDDVLDAAVVAWVAAGEPGELRTLPDEPTQHDGDRPVVMTVRAPGPLG